ncbi:MAG: methyltransferase domain-containing protein, partial [Victivallales bacterium]|jgi:ETFB lysine methyltransferase|nr:methyltransferase domain-containing protein [Victivallales bacterium]
MNPAFTTAVTTETVAGLRFELEMVANFELLLEHYVATATDEQERVPYYAHLWPASRALVTWMAERPDLWPGHRVLELGCGLGLPAITAATLGARHVTGADSHPDNGTFLSRNATRNGVQVDVLTMDWGRPALRSHFDAILGSDLVYETPMIEPLFWGVVQLLAPRGRFVLADPGRPPFNAVVEHAESLGFSSEVYAEDEGFVVEFTW